MRRRQRVPLALTLLMAAALVVFALFTLPSYYEFVQLEGASFNIVQGVPPLIIVYPVYIVACIGLSLDALLRPAPSLRMMGE